MSPPIVLDHARQGATAAQAAVAPFCAETRSPAAKFIPPLGARYVAEISALAPTATHIINKTPSNFTLVGLIHLALPNARIIHAVRDPANTCVSCFSKLFAAGQDYTCDLTEVGRYYRHHQALMEHWRRMLPPGRILDVHYEDVVADLKGRSRRIIVHCGLEWNARCLAFHETERPVRTASAAQVRQPIYSGAMEAGVPTNLFSNDY